MSSLNFGPSDSDITRARELFNAYKFEELLGGLGTYQEPGSIQKINRYVLKEFFQNPEFMPNRNPLAGSDERANPQYEKAIVQYVLKDIASRFPEFVETKTYRDLANNRYLTLSTLLSSILQRPKEEMPDCKIVQEFYLELLVNPGVNWQYGFVKVLKMAISSSQPELVTLRYLDLLFGRDASALEEVLCVALQKAQEVPEKMEALISLVVEALENFETEGKKVVLPKVLQAALRTKNPKIIEKIITHERIRQLSTHYSHYRSLADVIVAAYESDCLDFAEPYREKIPKKGMEKNYGHVGGGHGPDREISYQDLLDQIEAARNAYLKRAFDSEKKS